MHRTLRNLALVLVGVELAEIAKNEKGGEYNMVANNAGALFENSSAVHAAAL
jgi:hypothetical protein